MPHLFRLTLLLALAVSLPLSAAIPTSTRAGIITGATKGLGKALAEHLVKAGANVLITGRSKDLGEALALELNELGAGSALFSAGDVTSEEDQQRWVDETLAAWGKIDFAIANAGIVPGGSTVEELPLASVRKVLDVNVIGAWITMKLTVPHLQASEDGVLVHVTSVMGSIPKVATGYDIYGIYTASKQAQSVLVRMADTEGVRSYGLAPAVFISEILPTDVQWAQATIMNPLFGTPGFGEELGPITEAFLDGSTEYPSGVNVVADHEYTFPAQLNYNLIESETANTRELLWPEARDSKGAPAPLTAELVASIDAARLAKRQENLKDEL